MDGSKTFLRSPFLFLLTAMAFMLPGGPGLAQQSPSLEELLHQPYADCETIAGNAHRLISDFYFDDIDSMDIILNLWEEECGAVEPVLRLRILLDILENSYADSNYMFYMENYISKYENRIEAASGELYFDDYERYKVYFNYVPLRSRFDQLTRRLALDLLPDQKKGGSAYLFALLFSDNAEGFERELELPLYDGNPIKKIREKKRLKRYPWEIDLTLYAGMWSPVGAMTQNFNRNWNLGLLLGSYMNDRTRLDYGVMLHYAGDGKPFEMFVDGATKEANPTVGLTIGLWLTREFQYTKDLAVDAVAGVGFGVLETDLERANPGPEESKTYSVNTADFSLGVNIRKRVAKNGSLGLNLSWHLTPYKWDDTLVTDIGNNFVRFNVFYRFDRVW